MKRSYLLKDYEKVGITKAIQPFEDGLRTTGVRGEYEWWYFDTKLQGGGNLVIVFHTGSLASFKKGFEPHVRLDLTFPNGKGDLHTVYFPADKRDYSFSTEGCDVRIGNCRVKGDLHTYELHFDDGKIQADLTLTGSVPSWRPYAGQIWFNEKDYFAWLPSIPEGKAEISVTADGETKRYAGTGYHDHNWGNKAMFFLMHHWYWGRAKIGDYVVVSAFITSDKKRSYTETPVFMIAKDGRILADDGENCLTYSESDYRYDPVTKKHFAHTIVYDYEENGERYRVTYKAEDSIEKTNMKDILTWWQVPVIWLMGLRGSYHRVCGTATLEYFKDGKLQESISSPAIWEQMYFGKDKLRNA